MRKFFNPLLAVIVFLTPITLLISCGPTYSPPPVDTAPAATEAAPAATATPDPHPCNKKGTLSLENATKDVVRILIDNVDFGLVDSRKVYTGELVEGHHALKIVEVGTESYSTPTEYGIDIVECETLSRKYFTRSEE